MIKRLLNLLNIWARTIPPNFYFLMNPNQTYLQVLMVKAWHRLPGLISARRCFLSECCELEICQNCCLSECYDCRWWTFREDSYISSYSVENMVTKFHFSPNAEEIKRVKNQYYWTAVTVGEAAYNSSKWPWWVFIGCQRKIWNIWIHSFCRLNAEKD